MEQYLDYFLDAAANPVKEINRWKEEQKGSVIGCLPIYIPEEIIDAAGALPVYLWGGKTEIDRANAHLQGFACSIVRAVLEYEFKGTYDMVDGFVFPSTCDHIQNTSDIWAKAFSHRPKFDLVYPANRQSNYAEQYLTELYREFISWLEVLTGSKADDDALLESIKKYNLHRRLMSELSEIRAKSPQSLTGREMSGLVKASLFLPKDEYNSRLIELLPWLWERRIREKPKTRLVLTGILAEQEIIDIIEELGGCIVADDLARGARLHRNQVDESIEPLAALARRHLSLGPCSTLFDPGKGRGPYLESLCRETEADAVIFINMKFCEPEEFDYPVIKTDLEKAGIPLLFIEVEQQMTSYGQLRTRLQAFMEMLA
ncbi:MAG: 2-hydroxyacyl-CoA dehydratase [Dethiobacter sp.]|jgi:bcr-type benzoyl-CoA reductase subunit C|nr:2-hydroxyacyl-CoA dehydratase [Dethiobacter sp.]